MRLQHGLIKHWLPGVVCWLALQGVVAQTVPEASLPVQGAWVLDNVFIHETGKSLSIDPASVPEIEIYPRLDFVGNELVFSYNGATQNKEFNVAGELIWLCFHETAFYAEWKIADDKLYLNWGKDIPLESGDALLLSVALTYKRK